MTGKNGKVLGVTLYSEDKEQAEWVTPSGSAEKFVVTLTQESDTWTADKTIAEIVAADAAGKEIRGIIELGFAPQNLFCLFVLSAEGESVVAFFPLVSPEGGAITTTSVLGENNGESDVWQVVEQEVTGVPSYSSSNNGQVLGVSSGDLAWVASSAPLIVTLTYDSGTSNLVGDKTYKEVYDAYSGGQSVLCKGVVGSTNISASVIAANETSGEYSLNVCASGSIAVPEGTANEYLTLHVGN